MWLNFRLKIAHFYRRNKKKIYIVAIVIGIIIAINTYLGYLQSIEPPKTNYEPHNPIIHGDEITDSNTKSSIEEKIKAYVNYCNEKDYESAYNCLTDECKEFKFKSNINNFKSYVDSVFIEKKIYNIQDFSNKDNIYVYQLQLTEDILATGMNNEKSESVYEEYIVFKKEGNDIKFSISGYIGTEKMNIEYEDEYMKATITEKITTYEDVTYKIKVESKTANDIVFASRHDKDEVILSLNGDYRVFKEDDYREEEIHVLDKGKKEFEVTFNKFFDESRPETELILNKILVLKNYSKIDSKWEKEIEKPVKAYSVTFKLNNK
ncbi:MAG: hypothetical protein J6I85_07995 [Clostridia bacterium]|nr:hypothetical protein [Clostridia bacterium]